MMGINSSILSKEIGETSRSKCSSKFVSTCVTQPVLVYTFRMMTVPWPTRPSSTRIAAVRLTTVHQTCTRNRRCAKRKRHQGQNAAGARPFSCPSFAQHRKPTYPTTVLLGNRYRLSITRTTFAWHGGRRSISPHPTFGKLPFRRRAFFHGVPTTPQLPGGSSYITGSSIRASLRGHAG